MASLRARLLASVLALAAGGLLTVGGIVYAEQRSFLLDRADQQAHSAIGPVGFALDDDGDDSGHDPRPGGPPGRERNVGLPPGVYGEHRDASGEVTGNVTLAYDESEAAEPDVPDDLVPGRAITVGAKEGGTRFRVLAERTLRGGGLTVVAVPLTEADETLSRLLLVEGLVIAAVLIVLGSVAWLVVRVGLRPLDRIGHTAGAIAGGDLSHRVEATDRRTEVGRLGIAFNAMLDRLEQAFSETRASEDRLRRFIADASHELRTPLASIRGYAEVFRMGAARDRADIEKAMRRIEDEAARMGVLVEDLLTLARLDSVADAPHVELDLAPLIRDAVDDARVTAPDREIRLEARGSAPVVGDAHQLRQVLANLLRNALVHTPAGTPVDVTLATGERVSVEVRDFGPGLPTADGASLFERFWRAEGGRERGRGGAGLGLAIVAAIVDAHGGEVAAGDAPGGGAAFTVTLPAASVPG